MITLPEETTLIARIRDALNAVSDRHREKEIANAEWYPEIAAEIAFRVSDLNLRCYARGSRRGERARGCVGSEWLFDFCALIEDEGVAPNDRFMAQAAIVGEVEWSENGIDYDFEKLLIVDSLVCFMVFQKWDIASARAELSRLQAAATRRREYARQRGMVRPPEFLLSCWHIPERRFIHLPEEQLS